MNFSDQIKQLVGTVAPTLGLALGGPLGGAAGAFLAKALGVAPGDSKAAEAALVGATPETLLALKKADLEFQAHMADLDVTRDQLAYADVDSARKREMTVKDWTPSIIAYGILTLYAGVQIYLLTHIVADDMREIVMRSLGTLDAAIGLVLSYYFGSSASSRKKDDALTAAVQK
jgi:hypothetical protein